METIPQFRIGNQTSFAARSLLEPFEFAVANRFAAFEFFPDRGYSGTGGWDEREVPGDTREYIRRTAQAANLTLTVHAPLEMNLLESHEHPRMHSSVEFAQEIGATLLNLHLEPNSRAEEFVEALGPTLKLTVQAGLRLALENTVWTGPQHFNRCFTTLREHHELPSAHAGMTFDLGHANLYGTTCNDYWSYFDGLSPDVPLIHLHLHENYGDRDSHLTLFTGPSRDNPAGIKGFLERLKQKEFSGCAILEQWPEPPSLLVNARDRLMQLLDRGSTSSAISNP